MCPPPQLDSFQCSVSPSVNCRSSLLGNGIPSRFWLTPFRISDIVELPVFFFPTSIPLHRNHIFACRSSDDSDRILLLNGDMERAYIAYCFLLLYKNKPFSMPENERKKSNEEMANLSHLATKLSIHPHLEPGNSQNERKRITSDSLSKSPR